MKYFTQLLFILFISVLKAQTVNDSLIRLLSLNTTPDSVKIKLAGDISWNFLSNDIEKAMFYAKKELELAKKLTIKKKLLKQTVILEMYLIEWHHLILHYTITILH